MSKKIILGLTALLLLLTCVGCGTIETYPNREYLSLLVERAGLSDNEEHYLDSLLNWGVITEEDITKEDEDLDYDFLSLTITRLIDEEGEPLDILKDKGWIKKNKKADDLADKKDAMEVIDKAVDYLNSKDFESVYEYSLNDEVKEVNDYRLRSENIACLEGDYDIGDLICLERNGMFKRIVEKKNGAYILEDVDIEDVYDELKIEGSYKLDLKDAIDIPGGIPEDEVVYVNNGKHLLSSTGNTKTFTVDGFKVSYSISNGGIDARITRDVKGMNLYFDISVNNIHPSYKWDYKDGKLNDAYFRVDHHSTLQLGVSVGKYHNLYLDFRDKDPSSFLNALKSVIKDKEDEVETTIKICEIKTPIPDVPTAFLNIDILAKIYSTGKAEIVMYSDNRNGFEIRNGSLRYIGDSDKDIDINAGGSSRAALGLNFNLEATQFRLMDIEVDAGIRAAVATTIHVYDDDGNMTSLGAELPYSAVDEIAKENNEVKICGDLSLNWILDLYLNTSKTVLSKMGLSAKKTILDKGDQIFGNKTHIENGIFVSKCTRKDRPKTSEPTSGELDTNKILLEKYSTVIYVNETYTVPIKALPKGYSQKDLIYRTSKPDVASVTDGVINGLSQGASEITISTSDGKYYAALNILVSTG